MHCKTNWKLTTKKKKNYSNFSLIYYGITREMSMYFAKLNIKISRKNSSLSYLLFFTPKSLNFKMIILIDESIFGSRLSKGTLGLLWKQASTLFFNYTFISVYKIYFFYSVSKILFRIFCLCYWISLPIMILKTEIFLHTVHKIFNK